MNNEKTKRLIIIHGATGIGKTPLAIQAARVLHCPILSCDSRQMYREMNIGTAVPSPDELAMAKHYFIHDRSVKNPISAGEYEKEALDLLDNIFETFDNAIMTGGTGLYAAAVTQGLDNLPRDTNIRKSLSDKSLHELQELLLLHDPAYYDIIDLNNRQRLMRAVEVCLIAGRPYSALRTGTAKERPFRIVEIALDRPREVLYDRINHRVDIMIGQGLEDEAQAVQHLRHLSPLQTVGYREFFDYFDGKTTLTEAIRLIKQNTRHYAKRQYTWLRANNNINWFDADKTSDIIRYVQDISLAT